MSEGDKEAERKQRQRGDVTHNCTALHVAEERKEGAVQGKRAQRLERQLTEGDYLAVNFSVSSLDECPCNERVGVNL